MLSNKIDGEDDLILAGQMSKIYAADKVATVPEIEQLHQVHRIPTQIKIIEKGLHSLKPLHLAKADQRLLQLLAQEKLWTAVQLFLLEDASLIVSYSQLKFVVGKSSCPEPNCALVKRG